MPSKILTSPKDNKGNLKFYKFGGGANTIFAQDDLANPGIGYIIDSGGGDDTVFGSSFDDIITGGTGSDNITGGLGNDTIFGGEDAAGTDAAKGKDAVLTNELIGDEANIGSAVPGSPVINGTYIGGNDTIYGGDGGNNSIYGDNLGTVTLTATQTFQGGNDMLVGGDGVGDQVVHNNLTGDTQSISSAAGGTFKGGNDTLIGGSGDGYIDAGGGIILFRVSNDLVGDTGSTDGMVTTVDGSGGFVSGFKGGNDTLVSGTFARDTMVGDFSSGEVGSEFGGMDTFVFGENNGADTIQDFHSADGDVINLFDTGLTDFTDLAGHIYVNGTTTIIDLGEALNGPAGIHTIDVWNTAADGTTQLTSSDFSFNDWMGVA